MDDKPVFICFANEFLEIVFEMLDHIGSDSMCLLAPLGPIRQGGEGSDAPGDTALGIGI
jgi:hypothetical protein